jgi:hypothetical protein
VERAEIDISALEIIGTNLQVEIIYSQIIKLPDFILAIYKSIYAYNLQATLLVLLSLK